MNVQRFHNFYYVDTRRRILWILPPKCASTSIKRALGLLEDWVTRDVAVAHNHWQTIAFVRHPYDRIVSALFSCLREYIPFSERYWKHQANSHVVPQAPYLDGLRVDFIGRYHSLCDDWAKLQSLVTLPVLDHLNAGRHRPVDWRTVDFDWNSIADRYKNDLALCTI